MKNIAKMWDNVFEQITFGGTKSNITERGETMNIDFKKGDEGVYVNSTMGHYHLKHRLADLVEKYDDCLASDIMTNDETWCESKREAISILQEHTELGLLWVESNGDLLLIPGDEFDKWCH